jgi:3-(3-hydroxy-phenyl)propionate hydroxylase
MHHIRPKFAYTRSVERDTATHVPLTTVIVGAGPVGLSMALELASRGEAVTVLEETDTVSEGSRAIAYAARTLEIWNRLGVGDEIRNKGVSWQTSKVFHKDALLYEFSMQSDNAREMPAFVNLQQYHVEEFLIARCLELNVEIRWLHRVVEVEQPEQGPVRVRVDTPEGPYELRCEWLIAADGAKSQVRRSLGLTFEGRVFDERFLIMDIRMLTDHPAERWFWFDPPFNPGKSALLHMQADNIWRVGNQLGIGLGDDFDEAAEKSRERVLARLRAMLGDDLQYEIDWVSIFTFQCRRLPNFVRGNVIFVGDAAHQVSPFGGRGANSGVQDAENLAWKLQLVRQGLADVSLLTTYSDERGCAADENILVSTRTTDFVTPKTAMSLTFRDAVLTLAQRHPFARALVNSGRLSVASRYSRSDLNTPDVDEFATSAVRLGDPAADVRLERPGSGAVWLMRELPAEFTVIFFGSSSDAQSLDITSAHGFNPGVRLIAICPAGTGGPLTDSHGGFAKTYDAVPGTAYLFRPDRHLAARWRTPDADSIDAALSRACRRPLAVGR